MDIKFLKKTKSKEFLKEWLAYAISINAHKAIVGYIKKYPGDLCKRSSGQKATPRTWMNLSKALSHIETKNKISKETLDRITSLAKNYLGDTIGRRFIKFLTVWD